MVAGRTLMRGQRGTVRLPRLANAALSAYGAPAPAKGVLPTNSGSNSHVFSDSPLLSNHEVLPV